MLLRKGGGDVRFHVHRRRPGGCAQRALLQEGQRRRVDPGQFGEDDALGVSGEAFGQEPRHVGVSLPALPRSDDARADHDVARRERGIEPAGDPDAHHRAATRLDAGAQHRAQPVGIAASPDRGDSGSGGEARLARQARDRQDRQGFVRDARAGLGARGGPSPTVVPKDDHFGCFTPG